MPNTRKELDSLHEELKAVTTDERLLKTGEYFAKFHAYSTSQRCLQCESYSPAEILPIAYIYEALMKVAKG